MKKEAGRIRRIISPLKSPEDLAEIVKMAKVELAGAVEFRQPGRFERAVAIYEVASEALGDARVRVQLPRYPRSA